MDSLGSLAGWVRLEVTSTLGLEGRLFQDRLGKLRLGVSFLWNVSLRCEQRSLPSLGLGEGRDVWPHFLYSHMDSGRPEPPAPLAAPQFPEPEPGRLLPPQLHQGLQRRPRQWPVHVEPLVNGKQNSRTWSLDPTGNGSVSMAQPCRTLQSFAPWTRSRGWDPSGPR